MFAIKFLIFLITIILFGYLSYKSLKKNERGKVIAINPVPVVIGFLGMIATWVILLPAFGQVPAGHRGVILEFGKVTPRVLGEGLYMITPFVNSVELMDVQVHASSVPAAAASRDLQDVATNITVNYRLDASRVAEVYRDLRHDYVERVMNPAVQEAVKSATAQFDAEKLIIERPKVKFAIEDYLKQTLGRHGLLVDNISITDFKFSQDFAQAIEAKVTSTQLALKAQNDLQIVKAEAQQTIETAKAEAEKIRIQAGAINAQGGAEYVKLKAIEKWNGTVPQWVSGRNAIPFISMTPPSK